MKLRKVSWPKMLSEENIDDGVARDDPFVAASENCGVLCVRVCGKLESFNGRCASPDDNNLLALGFLACQLTAVVDFALEGLLVVDAWGAGVSTGAYSGDDTVKFAVGFAVDNPASLFVLGHLVDRSVEGRARVKAITFPKLSYLLDNLLFVWVSASPLNRRMEAVHHRVDLEARGIVHSLKSSQLQCLKLRLSMGTHTHIPPSPSRPSFSKIWTSKP